MSSTDRADREAIRDLLARYARAIDDRDFGALAACFTPDATAEFSGKALAPGVESIVRHLQQLRSIPASTHLIGNVLIELDGDEAAATSQAVVHLVLPAGEGQSRIRIRGVRYDDRFVRQDGRWLIARRVHRADWSVELPSD